MTTREELKRELDEIEQNHSKALEGAKQLYEEMRRQLMAAVKGVEEAKDNLAEIKPLYDRAMKLYFEAKEELGNQ